MTIDDLRALGFEQRGGALRAPAGTGVNLTALDGRCFRVTIELPTGGTVSAVISALALRSTKEEAR
jgi:hypothetical protein